MTTFKTFEMNLAVTLVDMGFEIDKIEKVTTEYGPRCKFSFGETPELTAVCKDFWAKRLTLEPDHLLDTSKKLKARMYVSD